ncbi:MAG TPA: dihydropteroate synthase, partial [Verrucomicrobiae bacterium]|nr:dihydropteroate synthase [Verrucomicrobiae bacterium]
ARHEFRAPARAPQEPMRWQARQHSFQFPRPVMLMGVVNVTPDSFSDGGRFLAVDAAVARAFELVRQGAEIIDIGGESTRPNAEPVSEGEELRRVLPVIEELAGQASARVSIDTQKPSVARAAIRAGACIVNDVAANRTDDEMGRVVAEEGAGYVCMHMQGTPQTMQANPTYEDVVAEVGDFFEGRLGRLQAAGVAPEQVVLDVGIGFGKSLEHNLQLLGGLRRFTRLGRPLLIGVSRKSFIGSLLGAKVNDRLPGSLACACCAVEAGVQIVRTHDVAETLQAVRMTEAILARKE